MDEKSIAKSYIMKAVYLLISAFVNILIMLSTKNFGMICLGLGMYFASIFVDKYMQPVYDAKTQVSRRTSYISAFLAGLYIVLLCILVIYFPEYQFIIKTTLSNLVIIIIASICVLFGFLDVLFYGYNEQELEARKIAKTKAIQNMEESNKLKLEIEDEVKKRSKEFIRSKARGR